MLYCPACSTVIRGAPRRVAGAPRVVTCAPRLVAGAPRLVASAPRLVAGAPRLVAGTPMCFQGHPKFSPAVRGVPKPLTMTPMVLLAQSSEIPGTLKAGQNPLLSSDTLLGLTHLGLHSTFSQTLQEASSNYITYC